MLSGTRTEEILTVTWRGSVAKWFAIVETNLGIALRHAVARSLSCPTGAQIRQKDSNQHKAQHCIHESRHLQMEEVRCRTYCWSVWLMIFFFITRYMHKRSIWEYILTWDIWRNLKLITNYSIYIMDCFHRKAVILTLKNTTAFELLGVTPKYYM